MTTADAYNIVTGIGIRAAGGRGISVQVSQVLESRDARTERYPILGYKRASSQVIADENILHVLEDICRRFCVSYRCKMEVV